VVHWQFGGGLCCAFGPGCRLSRLTAVLIWNLAIDGPHVFATASRTYFDKVSRQKLGWRLWMIIPFALVGPVLWVTNSAGSYSL